MLYKKLKGHGSPALSYHMAPEFHKSFVVWYILNLFLFTSVLFLLSWCSFRDTVMFTFPTAEIYIFGAENVRELESFVKCEMNWKRTVNGWNRTIWPGLCQISHGSNFMLCRYLLLHPQITKHSRESNLFYFSRFLKQIWELVELLLMHKQVNN